VICVIFIYGLLNPLDNSKTIGEFYKSNPHAGPDAKSWGSGGSYFRWQSRQPENSDLPDLNIFYRTFGNIKNPAIVMIHGWPTSSYDFNELINELKHDYYIAVIDTPGYGFSDKPKRGYYYSIPDDASLVDYFIQEILDLKKFILLTHDKGDSVGFAFLSLYQQKDSPAYQIDHHVILNGGIYLPLAELSAAQKFLTLPFFGQVMTRFILTPDRFTSELAKVYSPELNPDEQLNMSSTFKYQGGTTVFPKTLRYLEDRRKLEITWLQTLAQSQVSATLIWGERDTIAKVEIADFVWQNYLENRDAAASYWRLPCASHYPQNDQPKVLAKLIRRSLSDDQPVNASGENSECTPIMVDTHS
jgi:pimeloyl-ACP methyl ester carboxylesterase|tara:strand:- start:1277 stop:2353 length:1077 start_codon:yes stop_codon:yes gene_type:complete